ncbi:MAG: hypothetical protein ACFFES_15595 [Candidatus Thorarchaeota archaeon]
MRSERNRKFVTASLLLILMLILIVTVQENRTPTATYELIPGNPMNEDESIEITSSQQPPVTSALLLNDSVLSSDSIWIKQQSTDGIEQTYFSRQFPAPRINVSTITLRLSADVVEGPININLRYYDWSSAANVNGTTGETIEIIKQIVPDDLGRSDLAWITIILNSTDTSVLDRLYFSVSLAFTTDMFPITMDLQRTNGDSLFDLPEFYSIFQTNKRPYVQLNDYTFYFSQINDTIFLPAGTYSLSVRWSGYQHSFGDIPFSNESLYLEMRIKTIRLDVVSLQKVPGIAIYVGSSFLDEFYHYEILIADEPSFYLPSMSHEPVSVRGDVDGYYWPHHFTFYMDNYENQNITLVVSENWILIGNIAFTPGRFVMLIALVLIFLLTIAITRKHLLTSSIYLPFLFLFLGNILPMYHLSQVRDGYPQRIPFFSQYLETQTVYPGMSTAVTNINGTAITISDAGYEVAMQIGFISLFLVFCVFITVLYEYVRKESDLAAPDFVVVSSVVCTLVIQLVFIINVYRFSINFFTFSLGPSLVFVALALCTWTYLYKQQGKSIFETN